MSQAAVILPGSPLTGAAAAADMNAAWASMISMFSGTTAPTLGPGASSALVEGQFWLDTSQPVHLWKVWDGAQWSVLGYIDPTDHIVAATPSWRNILGDNGGLEVWQRGAGSSASFSVSASSTTYTADRWFIQTGANQASTVAAVAGLTNQSNLAAKVQRNNGQTGATLMAFSLPLDTDELVRLRGQLVSFSFVAKAGANWSPASSLLGGALAVGTGAVGKRGLTPYTGETLLQQTFTLTTSAQRFTFDPSSIVPTNTTQAEMLIFWTPTGTAGADDSFTIDDVQLEVGGPTLFERTPFEKSLLGCKRHFWKTFLYGTAPVANAGINTGELQGIIGKAGATALGFILPWRHPVSMRITPVAAGFNPQASNGQARWESGATGDMSATTTLNLDSETGTVTATGNAGAAVGDIGGIHLTLDAGI